MLEDDKMLAISRTVHEALRAWSAANGQASYPAWSRASKGMKQSTRESVQHVLSNPNAPPSAQHEQWLEQKRRDGWKFGPVKDTKAKTHPMLVPYTQLPEVERAKDILLIAITLALAPSTT